MSDPAPRELADQAAEAVRALNHATVVTRSAYDDPSELYSTVGALHRMLYASNQAFEQMGRWLDYADEQALIAVRDERYGHPRSAVDLALALLQEVRVQVRTLTERTSALSELHSVTSVMCYPTEIGDDDPKENE